MVRALIFLIIFSSSLFSQSNDPVQIFKIRPPEKRIEGLFTDTENTSIKTMYYCALLNPQLKYNKFKKNLLYLNKTHKNGNIWNTAN